jgi:hypothetical protein
MKKLLIVVGLITLTACDNSKLMTGAEFAKNDPTANTPIGKALVQSFDQDNGKFYCIPKMNDQEMGEFQAKIVTNSMAMIMNPEKFISKDNITVYDATKPLQSGMRIMFAKDYPCSK